nr:immunoglobulin light chain junction region [Macaca mulatta]MOW14434.1 immunoglobulin light chain junction region [Macaca mulatta]
CQQGYHNPSF